MAGTSLVADTKRRVRPAAGRARRALIGAVRRTTASARTLPTFLIVGAQKAGTTSLYEYLAEHPAVLPAATKEVHYFDIGYDRSAAWYRGHFPTRGALARAGRPGQVAAHTGESTPYYLFHPLAADRAAATLPDARLLVLLRDPVDRAFSHHNHERVLGFEDLSFADAVACESERLAGEEERIIADHSYRSFSHQHHSYLARGRYAGQLERWLARYGRERLLVLMAEELFADPAGTLHAAQRFLDLPLHTPDRLTARNARVYTPLSLAGRDRLRSHFAADDRRLAELLGRALPWE